MFQASKCLSISNFNHFLIFADDSEVLEKSKTHLPTLAVEVLLSVQHFNMY